MRSTAEGSPGLRPRDAERPGRSGRWSAAAVRGASVGESDLYGGLAVRTQGVTTTVARLIAAGAGVLRTTDDPDMGHYAVVLQDPEGNEFCVVQRPCSSRASERRAQSTAAFTIKGTWSDREGRCRVAGRGAT
ncbi:MULTISPECIES: VOC family protein [unclassified Streptomyces]|uniref:VOC family protein n=1 Tax=unclassified Streptomyces TaxID=2593676 RepID=UPI0037910388